MEIQKLSVGEVVPEGIKLGLKNFPSLLGIGILWALTIWIPYVNVGTTIALITLPAEMSRGNILNPLDIFKQKYYRYMGEFFICMGLMNMAILVGFLFVYIPGIVIAIMFMFAPMLLVDRGLSPTEALKESNKLTYGNKWNIFFSILVLEIVIGVVFGIFAWITPILGLLVMIVAMPVIIGLIAAIYGKLTGGQAAASAPAATV